MGTIHNSNLCTEITLNNAPDDEVAVCNLGSINLMTHMVNGELDEARIKETATTAMRMLDNVVDLNYYPIPKTKKSNMRHRPGRARHHGLPRRTLPQARIWFRSNGPLCSMRAWR